MAEAGLAEQVDRARSQVRDVQLRFRALPRQTRWAVWIAIELVLALVVFFVDHSLGVGLAVLFAILWLPRLEPRVRLGVEVALVVIFAIGALTDETLRSVPIVLAIGFLLSWLPWANRLRRDERVPPVARRWVVPALARYGLAA